VRTIRAHNAKSRRLDGYLAVARGLLRRSAMPNTVLRIFPAVVAATTLWVSTAAADVQKPAWCNVEGVTYDGYNPRDAVKEKDPRNAVAYLVDHLCGPNDETKQMYKEIQAAAKKWSATLDMTDADWKDAVDWAVQMQSKRNSQDLFLDFDSRSLSSLDAVEQWAFFQRNNSIYYADALGPKLTDLGRMGLADNCVRTDAVGTRAICSPDVAAFDVKKISAEIRTATKRSGYERMIARFRAFEMVELVKEYNKKNDELMAKDEAYKKLFAIAPPEHTAWSSVYSSDVFALALKMEDARLSNSRKAFDGCDDTTLAAWKAAIGKLPASTFEGIVEDPGVKTWRQLALAVALDDRDVYLASVALVTCRNRDRKPDRLAAEIGSILMWHPGHRGPRTQSFFAMMNSGIEPDNRSERIEYPTSNRDFFPNYSSADGGAWGRGEVGKIKKDGDKATITFAAEWAEQNRCTKSKETNKFGGWDTAGRPYYRTICLKWTTEKVNRANDPAAVSQDSMTGVKKGTYVIVDDGAVTAAFAKKDAKQPIAAFGVALK
jgi:hypothetical protein